MDTPPLVIAGRVLAGVLAALGALLLLLAVVRFLETGEGMFSAVLPVAGGLLSAAFVAWVLAEIAHDVRQIRARKP
jgi:hypothetical protein